MAAAQAWRVWPPSWQSAVDSGIRRAFGSRIAYLLVVASGIFILLNILAWPETGGAYFAAAKLAALTSYVFFAVSAVAQGRLAALAAQGATDRFEETSRRLFLRSDIVADPRRGDRRWRLAGPFLLELFGPGFREASGPCCSLIAALYRTRRTTGPIRVAAPHDRSPEASGAAD